MSEYDADAKQVGGRIFHLRDGFYFERNPSGSVTITVADGNPGKTLRSLTVPGNEWASAVASVSARGETGETFQEALDFHESTSPA